MRGFKKRIFLISLCVGILHIAYAQNTMNDICPLKVGSEIPDGLLKNENDAIISLTDLINAKPTILIFYRGAWCGYCIRHLAELNDVKPEIEKLGFQILGISVDQASKLEISQSKSESEIPAYSDFKAEVIRSFGLDWQVDDVLLDKYKNKYELDLEEWSGSDHHTLPVPAVFIIKDNIVQFQYVNPNYNTRLNANTLLAILSTL